MPEKFIERTADLKEIEKDVKNKFRWDWLEDKDSNGDFLSDYIRKVVDSGVVYCLYCNQRLNYSKKGKSFITRHAASSGHKVRRNAVKNTQSLPAVFAATASLESGLSNVPTISSLPYGAANNVIDSQCNSNNTGIQSENPLPPRPPSFKDRVSQQEALICSFIAEHTLPLSLAPHIIKLAQTLALDHKALQALSMERHTATYKLKYGVHEVTRKRLLNKMKETPFSINLDEATAKSNKKRILNILVCFFDSELGKSVTHLYSSIEMTIVNATTVHAAVTERFQKDGIPLDNLISSLSDSAAYMRGNHNGYEVKLRTCAPHLLDIDGDACHHIHNITKQFSSTLDPHNHLPHLFDDIHKDFKYCADIKQDFSKICQILGQPDKILKERVSHRWLSLYDSSKSFLEIADGLTLMYFSWLGSADKDLYLENVTEIYRKYKVSAAGRQNLITIMRRLRDKFKGMSPLGRKRKVRVCTLMFDKRREIDLLCNSVSSIFPAFKHFILSFETKKPMLHKIHDRMLALYRDFLKFFMDAVEVRKSWKNLCQLNIDDASKQIPLKHIFTGSCENTLKSMHQADSEKFMKRLMEAYTTTAKYMQKKLPLDNCLLTTLSLLDPLAFGNSKTGIMLKKLPDYFPTISAPSFADEIMSMQADCDIPTGREDDLDLWWNHVFKLKRYPAIQKIVTACLSIFSGPRVEQSFSMMNNIISSKASSISMSTYEAILHTKYHLLAIDKSSIALYKRPDAVTSPVDKSLAWHLQTSYSRYQSQLKGQKLEVARQREQLGCTSCGKRKASPGEDSGPAKRAKQ